MYEQNYQTIEIKHIYCWKAVLDTFSLGSSSRKHMNVELWLCFNPANTSCQVSYTIIPQFVEWTRLSLIPARFQRQPYPCLPHSILQAIFIFRVCVCFFFLLCDTSLVTIRHLEGRFYFIVSITLVFAVNQDVSCLLYVAVENLFFILFVLVFLRR